MKQFVLFFLAALLGGLVAGGVLNCLTEQPGTVVSTPAVQPVRLVNYTDAADQPKPVSTSSPSFDFKMAASRAMPTVVSVFATFSEDGKTAIKQLFERQQPPRKGGNSEGSGFFYTAQGHILTNYHVIESANKVSIKTIDNKHYEAEIVGFDQKTDIAVLKIAGTSFPFLELADSDAVEIGEWVLAVGHPLNLSTTVTAGILSAKGRSLQLFKDYDAIESFLQTDAAINPGNSGGPLVDVNGRLLGINTAIASKSGLFEGYSFAIPSRLVQRIADDIIQYGSYQRAFLGVEIYPLSSEAASRLGVEITQGVVIETLSEGGNAQKAGLRPNDIIVRANQRNIKEIADLTEIVGRAKVGDLLELSIYRGNELVEIVVKMLAD